MQLQDFIQVVCRKNAGPRRFTLDIILCNDADYQRASQSKALTVSNPLIAVRPPEGPCPTNVACGAGHDRRTLYITEAYSGTILRAHADVPARPMFSHA